MHSGATSKTNLYILKWDEGGDSVSHDKIKQVHMNMRQIYLRFADSFSNLEPKVNMYVTVSRLVLRLISSMTSSFGRDFIIFLFLALIILGFASVKF